MFPLNTFLAKIIVYVQVDEKKPKIGILVSPGAQFSPPTPPPKKNSPHFGELYSLIVPAI